MKIKVLLVEPAYSNKYPPLGLMKISTFHKELGDDVEFYKGDLKKFYLEKLSYYAIKKLNVATGCKEWDSRYSLVKEYISKRRIATLELLLDYASKKSIAEKWLRYFSKCHFTGDYPNDIKYDRIYVTTLFTFYWDVTIKTINQAKEFCKDNDYKNLVVGGIMASLVPQDIIDNTDITPIVGLLNKPKMIDSRSSMKVDEMALDYSILEEIEYKYPAADAYYSYMTRGCIRNCKFCAVPKIEPKYKSYIPIVQSKKQVDQKFGAKKDLLLLDNNVLASKDFDKIIRQIKRAGFYKGATYVPPNDLKYAFNNIEYNEIGYRKLATRIIEEIPNRLKNQEDIELYNETLDAYGDYEGKCLTKASIKNIYHSISDLYERIRKKTPKSRYIDFNQGVDARLLTDYKMKQLSTLAIRPLRIAFDSIVYKECYVSAIHLAAKYNIRNLSNYLLYNYLDKPVDLYQRMKINIDLCEELDLSIYSFPMKYNPVDDVDGFYKNRNYLGNHWNRKYIRTVQAVLNSTKGKIGKGKSFFEKAFGANECEFMTLLYMPETYIIYRLMFEELGLTFKWQKAFVKLTNKDKKIIFPIIESNNFENINLKQYPKQIQNVLIHYVISRSYVTSGKLDKRRVKKVLNDLGYANMLK